MHTFSVYFHMYFAKGPWLVVFTVQCLNVPQTMGESVFQAIEGNIRAEWALLEISAFW